VGTSLLTLGATGTAVGQFSLADGTRVAATGIVAKDGIWQPYASLYKKNGFLVGAVDFSDKGENGTLGGTLDWRRSASQVDALDASGGKFVAPAKGTLLTVKSGASNLSVSLSGGGLAAEIKESATLNEKNQVAFGTPNATKLSLRLDRSGGGFSGSFMAPGDKKATPLNGVILQGENRATGYFVRNGVRGAVEVAVAP
jgi:hypothetical protein